MTTTTSTIYCPLPVAGNALSGKARVCIASPDVSGPIKNGGIGTAYKALAMALVRGGHDVTILYPHGTHSEDGPISKWITFYASHGIRFVPLSLPIHTTLDGSKAMKLSYAVFNYLYTGTDGYDVIHFPEWRALGYYSILGRHQGLILKNSTLVVGLHSPHLWNMRYNREPVMDADILTLDFMERRCAALADVVVSPSAYMIQWCVQQGWKFPPRTYVQPYVLPESDVAARQSRSVESKITEIVFFGRLDNRKGLALFCEALDQSNLRARRDITVVFLGRSVEINASNSRALIDRRSQNWQCPVKLITDFGRDAAVNYLRQPGRLAVIASLADNSPNTVYECLSNGIAFVALRTGGIPEVISADDVSEVCCEADSAALARRLEQALSHPPTPARPAMDFAANEKIWNQWHSGLSTKSNSTASGTHMADSSTDGAVHQPSACQWPDGTEIGSANKQVGTAASQNASNGVSVCLVQHGDNTSMVRAINSLKIQDFPQMQVVLALRQNGEDGADTLVRQMQADFVSRGWKTLYYNPTGTQSAYAQATQCTDGKLLLLMDDSMCLVPDAVRLWVHAMAASGTDILTSSVNVANPSGQQDFNATPDHIRLFAGAPLAGLFNNVFGGNAVLVTREAYESLGGFVSPIFDACGIENHAAWWLFYVRAALSQYNMQCVPVPLIWSFPEAKAAKIEESPLDYVLADIYRERMDANVLAMLLFAQGIKRKADLALPHWQGHGPVRLGLRREIVETIKDIRRKTRKIRYLLKGKWPPRN